jgi:hypothetical protein
LLNFSLFPLANVQVTYDAFGVIETALSKKIVVFQSSSLKLVPITSNAW